MATSNVALKESSRSPHSEVDLNKLSGDEINAYYEKRRDEGANDAELLNITTNAMDAFIEEGQICHADVGFPGETSGGGYSDPEMRKLDSRMRFLKQKINNKEGNTVDLQKEYDELQEKKTERAESVATDRHEKVISKIGTVEELIKNPLNGMLKHDNGRKRKWVEMDALVQSRRKQEDLLLAQLKKDEEEEAKTAITDSKRKHDLAMAEIKQAQQAKKDDAKIAKDQLQAAKEKAAAEKAAAEKEKAAAEKEKATAEKEKAALERAKLPEKAKKEKKDGKEKKDKKEKKQKKEKKANGEMEAESSDDEPMPDVPKKV